MSEVVEGLQFRPFRNEDQRAVRALILEGLGDHFPEINENLNPDLDDINCSYVAKGHTFIVAELDGQIVGAGGLMALDTQIGQIVRVSVDKGHRRQGIGVAIVNQLMAVAIKKEYTRLLVETNYDWVEAVALYRHNGFLPYHRDEVSVYMQLELDTG